MSVVVNLSRSNALTRLQPIGLLNLNIRDRLFVKMVELVYNLIRRGRFGEGARDDLCYTQNVVERFREFWSTSEVVPSSSSMNSNNLLSMATLAVFCHTGNHRLFGGISIEPDRIVQLRLNFIA